MICVALLMYTAVFSFWHPMVPGAMNVETTTFKPGKNEFSFIGYNTHFKSEQKDLKLYVTCDNHIYFCTEITSAKSRLSMARIKPVAQLYDSNGKRYFIRNFSELYKK